MVALGIISIVRIRRNVPSFGECGGRHRQSNVTNSRHVQRLV
jgi:hypothetical protein